MFVSLLLLVKGPVKFIWTSSFGSENGGSSKCLFFGMIGFIFYLSLCTVYIFGLTRQRLGVFGGTTQVELDKSFRLGQDVFCEWNL